MGIETTLNFDHVVLVGREHEISCLQEAFQRVKEDNRQESIFLRGESGSGKTSLLNELQESCGTPFFIQGKFDAVSNHPMSAIREALSNLCIQAAESDNHKRISDRLRESLGSNCSLLVNALPECRRLLGEEMSTEHIREGIHIPSTDCLHRSFRYLIEVCQEVEENVVIMCMDDLQWADEQSWDLVVRFLHDFRVPRFLFVGTYRSDDISSEREIKIQHYSNGGKIQLINVHNLDMGNVNQLISSLLRMEKSKTEALAKIVFSKSAGNPHYTIEIVKTIEKQKLINYSLIHFGWEWDTESIKSNINVGDNIVDKIVSRMATLPVHVLRALTFASCFGPKFDTAILESVIVKLFFPNDPNFINHAFLMNSFEYASEQGIVFRHPGSSFYRFAHDEIHQALYSLIPQLRRPDTLHFQIGRILLELRQQNEDIGLTFLAAGQFNYSLHLIECPFEAAEIAKLYLFAAKESIQLSAYGPAAEYLRNGLYSIRNERWLQYDTQLKLLVYQAKVELCLGHFRNCRAAAEEIIQNANSLEEMTPAFLTCVDSYGAEGMMEVCIQEGLGFVKLMGVKLPQILTKSQ